MGKVVIGSLNRTKVEAVEIVFSEFVVEAIKAPSKVLAQPIGNEMTRIGAVNRARFVLQNSDGDYGIGFEGGVVFISDELYLCNWGALLTRSGDLFTASGFYLPLPKEFSEPILAGEELGNLIERYSEEKYSRTKEGAIGLFTNELIVRKDIYVQLATLLKGQLLHHRNNKR